MGAKAVRKSLHGPSRDKRKEKRQGLIAHQKELLGVLQTRAAHHEEDMAQQQDEWKRAMVLKEKVVQAGNVEIK